MRNWMDSRRVRLLSCTLVLLTVPALAPTAKSLDLVRGPYLQLGTPSSMIVRWRTDLASDTELRFGSTFGNLATTVSSPGLVTEHEVSIDNLDPSTRYYYSVGSSSEVLAGADADHYFVTSPPVGTNVLTRLWVIGDSGGNSWRSAAVEAEYLNFAGSKLADVWLMLGDNAYLTGTDAEYTTNVFENYPEILRNTVLWPTPGNHEFSDTPGSSIMEEETGPYYDAFTLPTQGEAGGVPSGTETYYSYDYANVHLVSLNVFPTSYLAGSPVYNWLVADLAATEQQWIIVYLHIPPYSRGGRDSDTDYWMSMVRTTYNPVFEAAGVDLVLAGHSHSYERSKLIDGHYGVASSLLPANVLDGGDGDPLGDGRYRKPPEGAVPHRGTVYVVNGVGENAHVGEGTFDHPVMATSVAEMEGSMVIDIEGNELDAYFISREGNVLDRFGMVKAVGVPSLDPSGFALLCLALLVASAHVVRRRVRRGAGDGAAQ